MFIESECGWHAVDAGDLARRAHRDACGGMLTQAAGLHRAGVMKNDRDHGSEAAADPHPPTRSRPEFDLISKRHTTRTAPACFGGCLLGVFACPAFRDTALRKIRLDRSALPAVRGCRHRGRAAVAPSAAVAVPGHRRHGAGAAGRHAEPGDDRRAGRSRSLVALMIPCRSCSRPFRALIGYRSDIHRSALGWLPRALHLEGHDAAVRGLRDHALRAVVLSGFEEAADAPAWIGHSAAALAFLLVGAGVAYGADRGAGAPPPTWIRGEEGPAQGRGG